ncbi:MAG: RelA/SpoT domain-containing protein, partial [Dehalococcoidia bacterium]|nr:RelA/SpoT domain-containing protein [Dehalococcoidia bacterium]
MTETEYKEFLRPHTRAVRQILVDLDFFIEDIGPINVFSISSRLKEYRRAIRKSRRLDTPIQDLQDLAGIRIVVATQHEVDVVARFFYREESSKDLEIESDDSLSRESGYRARHIIAVVQPCYTRSMHPARIEVQLVTVLQHAFNFMSRAWVYKSQTQLSEQWHTDFVALSKELRKLDKRAGRLHAQVISSASTLADEAILTPMSYQRLVQKVFGEDISLDEAIDSCRFMVDLGCRTNGAVRLFFEDERIEELRQRFGESTSGVAKSWGGIVEEMSKHSFWLIFGTQYEVVVGLLEEENQTQKPPE